MIVMTTPSLGMRLLAQARATVDYELALEHRAASLGACAQQDLALVRAFFQQAAIDFSCAILAGVTPPVIAIGHGRNEQVAAILQTYRWKEGEDVRCSSHTYHALWLRFLDWCVANDLQPGIACRRDAGGKERWFTLSVRPATGLS
jgi:hypothetical protein